MFLAVMGIEGAFTVSMFLAVGVDICIDSVHVFSSHGHRGCVFHTYLLAEINKQMCVLCLFLSMCSSNAAVVTDSTR